MFFFLCLAIFAISRKLSIFSTLRRAVKKKRGNWIIQPLCENFWVLRIRQIFEAFTYVSLFHIKCRLRNIEIIKFTPPANQHVLQSVWIDPNRLGAFVYDQNTVINCAYFLRTRQSNYKLFHITWQIEIIESYKISLPKAS